MKSVARNEGQENGYKQIMLSHSFNHCPIEEIDRNILKPEKAAEMLRKRGVDLSVEQIDQILQLLRKFAHIVVSQYLESQKKTTMHKSD